MSGTLINPRVFTSLCNGPATAPYVLPICSSTPAPSLLPSSGTMVATSMCNGHSMFQLWYWQNNIVAVTQTSPAPPSYASWLYLMDGNNATAPSMLPGILFTPPKPRPRPLPAVIRAGRRAVRRSIDIYARFRGMDEIRRFVRGEEITYEGQLYRYKVRKTLKVVPQTMNPGGGHIPYGLRIVDKQTDKYLASGCVYVSGVPVIDQLLILSFHIQDEKDERKFIEATNWNPRLPRRLPMLQAA